MKLAVIRPMPEPISTSVCEPWASSPQPERREVRAALVVAGLDELGEAELATGDVVEHPPGLAHDLVGGTLLLGGRAGGAPRHVIASHRRSILVYFRSGSGAE